jgi:hypothetical protein
LGATRDDSSVDKFGDEVRHGVREFGAKVQDFTWQRPLMELRLTVLMPLASFGTNKMCWKCLSPLKYKSRLSFNIAVSKNETHSLTNFESSYRNVFAVRMLLCIKCTNVAANTTAYEQTRRMLMYEYLLLLT